MDVNSITSKQKAGASGLGIALVSAALGKLVPDIPDYVWILGLAVGLVLIAYSALPRAHEWLSDYIGGCLSLSVLGVMGALIVGLLAFAVYDELAYKLSYKVCFNHDFVTDKSGSVRISKIYVETYLVNENSFPIATDTTDNSLIIGNAANRRPLQPSKGLIGAHNAPFAIPDYVEFDTPVAPGPVSGQLEYDIHYGKDPSKPLPKKLIVKGQITGAITPDGHVGGFSFTPANDGDPSYIPEACQAVKDHYVVRSPFTLMASVTQPGTQ